MDGKNLREIKRKEIASYLSFLSQMSRVYYSFSVYETVMQGRYVHGGSFFSQGIASRDREVVEETLESLRLSEEFARVVVHEKEGRQWDNKSLNVTVRRR